MATRGMMALRLGTINTGAISHVPLTMEGEGESHDAASEEVKAVAMRMRGFLETGTTPDSMADDGNTDESDDRQKGAMRYVRPEGCQWR